MLDNLGNQTWYMNQVADRLGIQDVDSESTFLIIHTDDFGGYAAANIASIECMQQGSVTSASIMPTGLAYDSAVAWSVSNPDFDMGVHFTTTSEWVPQEFKQGPLTNGVSLTDSDGFFRRTLSQQKSVMTVEDCNNEMKAQIDRLLNDNVLITHADHHMGTTSEPKYLDGFLRLCDSYNICGFTSPRVSNIYQNNIFEYSTDSETSEMANRLFHYPMIQTPTWEDYVYPETFTYDSDNHPDIVAHKEYIKTTIDSLGPGIYKMIVHPAMNTPELTAMMNGHHAKPSERVLHYHTFRDNDILTYCASRNIHVISYGDLYQVW